MRRKKFSTVIVVLVIIAGLSFILYPTVSNFLKSMAYHRAIDEFVAIVENIDEETYDDIMAAAIAYNEKLLIRGNVRTPLTEEEQVEYNELLKIDSSGIMGYIVIPKINASLPIYHGTSEAVLQSGIGHLDGSSLPIGGAGSHSVLSGHRGLPSAKLFTNIDQLVIGDTFTVRVRKEVLTYEVDEIKTVLPSEVNSLQIVEGEDYCTLLTCTPYGVNSHRLLVRGHRIPTPEGQDAATFDRLTTEQNKTYYYLPLVLGVAVMILVILLTVIMAVVRRRKNRRKKRMAKHINRVS